MSAAFWPNCVFQQPPHLPLKLPPRHPPLPPLPTQPLRNLKQQRSPVSCPTCGYKNEACPPRTIFTMLIAGLASAADADVGTRLFGVEFLGAFYGFFVEEGRRGRCVPVAVLARTIM